MADELFRQGDFQDPLHRHAFVPERDGRQQPVGVVRLASFESVGDILVPGLRRDLAGHPFGPVGPQDVGLGPAGRWPWTDR